MVRSRLMRAWLLLLVLLLLPLKAQAEEPPFTLRKDIGFDEPYSTSRYNQGIGSMAKIGLHTYYIPARLREDTARACITQAEAAMTALFSCGAEDRAVSICLVAQDYPPRAEGNSLYIGVPSFAGMAYITGLSKLLFGNSANYGLLYGVSCGIAAELGIPLEEPLPLETALFALSGENSIYLDMNYACFIAPYAEEALQASVRTVARAFASSLTAEEKARLLTDYSDEAFYTRLNQFLTAHGQPAREDQSLWGIAFHGGGIDIRLCWESELAVYAVDDGFRDFGGAQWQERFGRDAPLNSGYADLRDWVLIFEDILRQLQGKFAPYTEPVRPVILFESDSLTFQNHSSFNAYYMEPPENTAHIGTVESVGHEYIHAMLCTADTNWDMHEMVAYYYSEIAAPAYPEFKYSWWVESFGARDEPGAYNYRGYWSTLEAWAAALLGHTPDYAVPQDLLCMMDLYVYTQGIADANVLDKDVINVDRLCAKFSWWRYISEAYGEDALLRAATENMPEIHLHQTWSDAVQEWLSWLDMTYGPAQ